MRQRKTTENRATLTVEEAINFALDGAAEAFAEVNRRTSDEAAAELAAREAFRNLMPLLESKHTAKCYIGCIAQGVNWGFFTTAEARVLMYGAQVWLQMEDSKR